MKRIQVNVMDSFYDQLKSMVGSDQMLTGSDFRIDSVVEEMQEIVEKGADVPVLVCNVAFRTCMSHKGKSATATIRQNDEWERQRKEKV